jgi:hypothetical protein
MGKPIRSEKIDMKLRSKIILAVILLFAAFVSVVGINTNHVNPRGKEDSTLMEMKQLAHVIDGYKEVCEKYPTTEQGFSVIDFKPKVTCLKEGQLGSSTQTFPDGWGQPLKYSSDGTHYRIESPHGEVLTGP